MKHIQGLMSKVLHTPTSDVLRLTSSLTLSLSLLLALPAVAATFDVSRDGTLVSSVSSISSARNAIASGAAGAWTIKANADYTATEYNVLINVGATKPVTFDTNGKTITIRANTRLFIVRDASSLTLAGNGTFAGNGTLSEGSIAASSWGFWPSGALATIAGGPVGCVSSDGSILILDGPTVRNFRTEAHGGAFCTTQKGNLEIRNGLITGCYSGKMGGGAIGLEGQGGIFKMTGGTICGNTANNDGGGGIASHSTKVTMILTGGVISNNVSSTTGAGINGNATITVGGDFKCVDNVDASTKGNLYLPSGVTLAVTNAPALAAGAQIGVLTQTPAVPDPVAVTGTNDGDYSQYFTSDAGYTVTNEANVVKLVCCFNVAFHANRAEGVTRDGAAFSSTNAVIVYGSKVGIPQLACEGLTMVGWSKTAGATEPEYTDAEVATLSTEPGSSHTLYAVWKATVRIPVFVALDGLGVVPQDGRTYEFSITNGSVSTPLQPCCTNLFLACPAGTGDVYRVGFATNDVTNPWTLALGKGTYIYNIRQRTVARPGEQLAEGTWCTCVKVDLTTKPYVTLKNDYLDTIDDLSEGAFKSFKNSGEASFSSEERYIILGSDTQTVGFGEKFNRALVKSKFAFDFSRSFRVDGTMQVGNAADGTAIGFVPNGQDLNTSSDFSGAGAALGCYQCAKNGNGLFLEFDTLGDGSGWGGQTDYIGETAHFVLTTTNGSGEPSNVKGRNVVFGANYALPSEVMNYSIDYDSFSKEMLFTIKTTTQTWKLAYTNPPAVFGGMKAYMTLSGAMRYSPACEYVPGKSTGDPAPKTKITIATFNYVNDSMTGAVENTFRNRQEALVTYDANGGEIVSGIETTAAFANAARYDMPVDPERKDYDFLGWFTSWSNGTDTVRISHGEMLSPIADRTVYAKWASKAIGEDTLKFGGVLDEDGNPVPGVAGLEGATNGLTKTDFVIPDMSDNGSGAGAQPVVQIKEFAFCAEQYDRKYPGKELTSVTIPLYVTEIQPFAFENCTKLTNVTFSTTRDYATHKKAALLIDDWAFAGSDVKEVVFPAGSKIVLGKNCFSEAKNLKDIYILGEVEVEGQYPFRHIGENLPAGTKVKVHLSPTLAASADYVYALTNGMDYAHVEIDQGIEGKVEIVGAPDLTSNPMTFTFRVETDSPWLKVTETTIYLFYSTELAPNVFVGTENVIYPKEGSLVDKGDGKYEAKFAKPVAPAAGEDKAYFQLCIGADRLTETGMVINHRL